jgi:hypothetical protein
MRYLESAAGSERRDFRIRRSDLPETVSESEGASEYDAIVDQIDWNQPSAWLTFLRRLNESQRVLVSLWQVHEHAMFNGIEASVEFHGRDIIEMAADGAERRGSPSATPTTTSSTGNQPLTRRLLEVLSTEPVVNHRSVVCAKKQLRPRDILPAE